MVDALFAGVLVRIHSRAPDLIVISRQASVLRDFCCPFWHISLYSGLDNGNLTETLTEILEADMAGIRKTLCGTYEVYGYRLQADGTKQRFSKTFKTRAEAKRFAAELDISAEQRSSSITLAALIDDYISEVTVRKRSKRTEEIRLRRLQRDKLGTKTLSSFTNRTIENYIERRLNERALHRDTNVLPSTVNRELTILSDVFQYAIKNELTDVNPCRGVENLESQSTASG